MNFNAQVLKSEFFRGVEPAVVAALLKRFNAVKKVYKKGEAVFHAGFQAERMLLLVSGEVHVYEHTAESRPVLIRKVGAGEVLGLWMLFVPEVPCWPGYAVATENTTVLSMDMEPARALIAAPEPEFVRVAINVSRHLAQSLFTVWRKLLVMDAQTIKTRVLVYLNELDSESGGTGSVVVPFDRERMAEYLGVTRPALSRALCQLRDEGYFDWQRNVFTLKRKGERQSP